MTANMWSRALWAGFLILSFVVTLPVSWWLLSKVDFTYAYLHDHAGIAENIERYAPKNIYKDDFVETTKEKRLELFSGIVESIQNKGSGLESLSYPDRNHKSISLLTKAEVIHLQDVAVLLKKASLVAGFATLLWLIIVFWMRKRRQQFPPAKQVVATSLIVLLIIASILSLGPEKVFNQLHIWAFPDNHQWFFYYEESLMSTMMKAPYLFAYIAALWFLVSAMLTVLLWKLLRKLMRVALPPTQTKN